jgi:hypothetical protein
MANELEMHEEECYVALSYEPLDAKAAMDRVRSPKAGAIVLFAGDCYCQIPPAAQGWLTPLSQELLVIISGEGL